MLSLSEHLHQSLRLQPLQVNACGGRSYVGNDRQLGASACTAIAQAVQHAGTRGLANRCRDAGGCVVMVFDIHTLILNEACLSDNWHNQKEIDSRSRKEKP